MLKILDGNGKLGQQNEQKVHRDKNYIRAVTRCHNTVAGDGEDFYIQSSKRKAREEYDHPGKMDVKSVIPGESVTSDESKGRERSEKKLDSGKKKDKCANAKSSRGHSEYELGDGHKNLKLSRKQRNLLKVREARRIWRVLHPQMKATSKARRSMMVKILSL